MNTIDNTMNAEYTPESDKNIMSWGRVVKMKNRYDDDTISYNVRFNPELYNITFKSGYDQDDYIIDMDSDIVKIINQTCRELNAMGIFTDSRFTQGVDIFNYDDYNELTVYADTPRYGASRHFKFKDETIAHTFAHIVNIRFKEVK